MQASCQQCTSISWVSRAHRRADQSGGDRLLLPSSIACICSACWNSDLRFRSRRCEQLVPTLPSVTCVVCQRSSMCTDMRAYGSSCNTHTCMAHAACKPYTHMTKLVPPAGHALCQLPPVPVFICRVEKLFRVRGTDFHRSGLEGFEQSCGSGRAEHDHVLGASTGCDPPALTHSGITCSLRWT